MNIQPLRVLVEEESPPEKKTMESSIRPSI
jgi:hypothetical protein